MIRASVFNCSLGTVCVLQRFSMFLLWIFIIITVIYSMFLLLYVFIASVLLPLFLWIVCCKALLIYSNFCERCYTNQNIVIITIIIINIRDTVGSKVMSLHLVQQTKMFSLGGTNTTQQFCFYRSLE